MKNFIKLFSIIFLFGVSLAAQELVPATSEDEEMFERQLEAAQKAPKAVTGSGSNTAFKELVKEEAKKLKQASVAERKNMGATVSDQKRQNSNRGAAVKDGRNSSPTLNNAGGAPGSPGKSGNRSKK